MPFTVEQFLRVFRAYNEAIWPAQWLLALAGVAAVGLAMLGGRRAGRAASALLGLLWLWTGAVYHLGFFARLSPAGMLFGALFVAQGALLMWEGAHRTRLRFAPRADLAGVAGAAVVLYALVVYPLVGALAGHEYPATPTFGAPCPVDLLTFGLLLWSAPPAPRRLFVVPALWAALGVSAALQLGMAEDYALPIVAVLALAVRFSGGSGRLSPGSRAPSSGVPYSSR